MTHRRLAIGLHWSILMLALVMVKGGIQVARALANGMLCKPGPKLTWVLRTVSRWVHRATHTVLAVTVVLNGTALVGAVPHDTGWAALLVLLAVGSFHGLYQFWRHNVLFDGALRVMTPRFMHKIL